MNTLNNLGLYEQLRAVWIAQGYMNNSGLWAHVTQRWLKWWKSQGYDVMNNIGLWHNERIRAMMQWITQGYNAMNSSSRLYE